MNLIPGLNWLTAITSRRASAVDGDTPDPADMGTAFGLDASIESNAESQPAPTPEARTPWSQRLVRRPRR